MPDLDALNRDFALDGLRFEAEPGGLVRGVVQAPACDAEFYLHGAQVTRWRPTGHDDVLWLSQTAVYEDSRAIRGGVPICFPWFGAHPSDPGAPSHGLARRREWSLVAAERLDDAIEVTLEARIEPWACRLTASFGSELRVALDVRNESDSTASSEAALHTYFAVADVETVTVEGLERIPFVDQAAGGIERDAEGSPVAFRGEVDRIYLGRDDATVTVRDAGRRIMVTGEGARSTVVWNPGPERARALADLGESEWRRMVCVESADVRSDRVVLAPGESARLGVAVRVSAS